MKRTFVLLAFAGVVVGSASLGVAQAARNGVTPAHGSKGCKTRLPHVINAGRAPLAPLRVDLSGISHHTQALREVETFARRIKLADGTWHPITVIRKIAITAKGGDIAGSTVAITTRNTTSFPRTRTSPGGKGGTFSLKGRTDAKTGGFLGGSAGNDRFPDEPIGVGGRWSIVNCDYVNEDAPAKEIRTYTVRSLAHGFAVVSYREVISMDPAHRDLGTQTIAKKKVHLVLDRLSGTTTGNFRVPLGRALAASTTQVTKVEFEIHATVDGAPGSTIVTRLVDSRKDRPSA